LLAGLLLGLAGLGGSAAGIVTQFMPRTFSPAQRSQIMAWEVGKRWRSWPAGRIFPASVRYTLTPMAFGTSNGLPLTAHRVGIARQAPCGAAATAAVARVLGQHGCAAMLRATYDDKTQTLAVTVGVAVLPGDGAAQGSVRALPGSSEHATVRAVPFRHTVVARFGARQRQLSWHQVAGPYVVLASVGFADGRPWLARGDNYIQAEMMSLASGVGHRVASALDAPPPQPHCPGSPGC
jgi:hypothetical protein